MPLGSYRLQFLHISDLHAKGPEEKEPWRRRRVLDDAWRAGKTSLLKMLPRLLPDTVCVFFDVQAHPAVSVGAFWSKLAEQARIQAKVERRMDLPTLPEGPPMEAAAAWLEKLDQLPGGRRC